MHLKTRIRKNGFTLADVAEQVKQPGGGTGVSVAYISSAVTGSVVPEWLVDEICRVVGIAKTTWFRKHVPDPPRWVAKGDVYTAIKTKEKK